MKIAALISSYKRFSDLSRQILSMHAQTYKGLHVFVAVKGFSEYVFETKIRPQFSHLEKEGFLTIRCFPNKNQLSNLLDTIRDLNVDEYDLFLKIDDDDFYDTHYVEDIVRFHSHEDRTKSSAYQPDHMGEIFTRENDTPTFKQGYSYAGPTFAMRGHIIDILQEIEANPSPELISRHTNGKDQHIGFGFTEDNLIDKIMTGRNERLNRYEFIYSTRGERHFTGNKTTVSTTRDRNSFLFQAFSERNRNLSLDKKNWEDILTLNYRQWHEDIRLFDEKVLNFHTSREGTLLERDDNSLTIKWENDHQETFVKTNRKTYDFVPAGQFDMLVVSLPDSQKKREDITRHFGEQNLVFTFSDGVVIDDYNDIDEKERNCLEAYRIDHLKTDPVYVNRAIGCKRAMINAIKKVANFKNWGIIFQDDIRLAKNFNAKLNMIITQAASDVPDCGVIMLHKAGRDLKVNKLYKHIISDVRSMAAFAVHPAFAMKLAEKLENWGGEDDLIWGELAKYNSRLILCADAEKTFVSNNQKDSDIISGIKELEYYWK